jgi:hypothetical protein
MDVARGPGIGRSHVGVGGEVQLGALPDAMRYGVLSGDASTTRKPSDSQNAAVTTGSVHGRIGTGRHSS